MIGRIIEEEGQKVIQTLAGATAGTVCKVNYGADNNYTIPITLNESGEGYIGISCACPGPYYNPTTGTLTVDNICSKSSDAENADKVLSNSLTGDTVYNMAMWCATSDGCYNSIGFSGGRSITYNPYTATLNTCCGNFTSCVTTHDVTSCTVAINGTMCLLSNLNIENSNGCLYGSITAGKLSWECGALFTEKPVCISSLCVGTTVESPSGCFLVRNDSGLVSYDDALTLANDTLTVSTGLTVSGTASLSNVTNTNYYICCNGNACFNGCLQVCGGIAGKITNSMLSCCMSYVGWGCCAVTAYSTSNAFEGSAAGWANYLLFAHGCGSSYYGQAIRMPFSSSPQYMRRVNGTVCGWYDFITSENIASQTVCSAKALCVDNTVCAVAERTNQLNICSASCRITWINYRGGSSILNIGDGTGNGQYGTLNAKCIYGSTCVYSNGSPTITAACFNCCLKACCVPSFCVSGNTLVICTR